MFPAIPVGAFGVVYVHADTGADVKNGVPTLAATLTKCSVFPASPVKLNVFANEIPWSTYGPPTESALEITYLEAPLTRGHSTLMKPAVCTVKLILDGVDESVLIPGTTCDSAPLVASAKRA